jgi:hypothetical protein
MDFEITFKSGRFLVVRGIRLAATHRNYGPTTYIEDAEGKHVFQCNSDQITAVVEKPSAIINTDAAKIKLVRGPFHIVFKTGKSISVEGSSISISWDYSTRRPRKHESRVRSLILMSRQNVLTAWH